MTKRQPCIYKITNVANGKVYIGQTKVGLHVRKREHVNKLKNGKHRNIHLKEEYAKYGLNSFVFEIIQYCSVEDLEESEKNWIKKFNSDNREYGYNIESGGNKGKKMPKEAIERMVQNKDYSKTRREGNGRAQKIICINDGKIFNCIKDASDFYSTPYTGTICSVSGSRTSVYSSDGNWYQFAYYEEGKEYILRPIKKKKPSNKKKVKCLNTGEIFESVRKASESTGIYRSFVTSICNGELEEREGMKFEYVYE